MKMGGEHYEGVHLDVVALGGAGEDADEDFAQPWRGLEQEAALGVLAVTSTSGRSGRKRRRRATPI
jgi:hypothetical protein